MLDYFIMSQNQYFRAGTGAIIYNEDGQILIFSRKDNPEIWQLQQGGQDIGENVEDTLWRELREETALLESDFTKVDSFPDWTLYTYSDALRKDLKDSNCLGQAHRWFFLKLKPETKLDLTEAHDDEFIDFKWCTFAELLAITDTLKFDVYTKLAHHFEQNIL